MLSKSYIQPQVGAVFCVCISYQMNNRSPQYPQKNSQYTCKEIRIKCYVNNIGLTDPEDNMNEEEEGLTLTSLVQRAPGWGALEPLAEKQGRVFKTRYGCQIPPYKP